MSIRHMADVWADPYFGQGDKVKLLVALAIADHANSDTGMAWPALEKLAQKSRTSVRGAQEALREMERDGKLEIHVGKGPSFTNLYRITPRTDCTPADDLQRTPPHAVHPARRAPRKRAAEKAAEKAALDCTLTIRNHQEPLGIITLPAPPAASRGVTEGKGSDRIPTTQQSQRIAAIFHRKLTTAWSEAEVAKYKRIGIIPEDDLDALERYYAAERAKGNEGRHRRDLTTFLNNFAAELDRARNYMANPNGTGKKPDPLAGFRMV